MKMGLQPSHSRNECNGNEGGEIKDAMDDANVSIQNMANDAGNTAAMSQGVGVLADSFSVFQAGMAAVGLGGEDMMKVYAKMMILQQGFNSLTQITNALQSESVLMLKLKAIWQKAVLVFTQQQAAACGKILQKKNLKNILDTPSGTMAVCQVKIHFTDNESLSQYSGHLNGSIFNYL